jgi:fructose-1-phosphate kinase PfkB-like protein
VCVSLAPSLDRYLRLPAFTVGAINRPASVVERAGGKALNVARTAKALAVPVRSLVWPAETSANGCAGWPRPSAWR